MIASALFASSFVTVFALGFQQQNVTGRHYWAAFFTSFLIGGSQIFLWSTMPGADVWQVAATLIGGPFGIVASMWVHRRTIGKKHNAYFKKIEHENQEQKAAFYDEQYGITATLRADDEETRPA